MIEGSKTVNTESLLLKIKHAVDYADVYYNEDINIVPEASLESLDWDDLDILYVIMTLEEDTNTDIEGDADDFKTVQDIINALVKAGITE